MLFAVTSREILPVTRPVRGTAHPPGSKSITNRALILAALADGVSVLRNALFADDSARMRAGLLVTSIAPA